jgi:molybdate transport system ATP-binding protein
MSASAPVLTVDAVKRMGDFELEVRLAVGEETLVLFGPSGAGKTTTLSAIAGLVTPDAGEIVLDGVALFRRGRAGAAVDLPARRRSIGYVFQSYALFPHMTALENVAYSLWRKPDARARAEALLERVHLTHVADRYPDGLSGGQQQRVALARALAAEPRVLLLDEPFSALDTTVRERLQRDLRALQSDLGLVMLYVTHRLEDAFALGHRLAVVREGRVAQVGTIQDVLRRPASRSVAQIMGIRNLLGVRVISADASSLRLDWGGLILEALPQPAEIGAQVTAYIRPEAVKIVYPDRPLADSLAHNLVEGTVTDSLPGPSFQTAQVLLENGLDIEVRFPTHAYATIRLDRGARVRLALRRDALIVLSESSVAAQP